MAPSFEDESMIKVGLDVDRGFQIKEIVGTDQKYSS
jgi:hypothetical protein